MPSVHPRRATVSKPAKKLSLSIIKLKSVNHILLVYIDVVENVESVPKPRATFTRSIRSASVKSFDEIHALFDEMFAAGSIRIRCADKGITDIALVDKEIALAKMRFPLEYYEDGHRGLAGTLNNPGPKHYIFMVVDEKLHLPYFNSAVFTPHQVANEPFDRFWLRDLKESIQKMNDEAKWKVNNRVKYVRSWIDDHVKYIKHAAIRAFGESGVDKIPELISTHDCVSFFFANNGI